MPESYKKKTIQRWAIVILLGFLLLAGCGKKAPPVAPRQPPMRAVTDLAAQYENGRVTLAWQHSPSSTAITGYLVFKYGQPIAEPACPGCPLLFEKMDSVSLDPSNDTTRQNLSWSLTVANGFEYTFKVVPVQSSGARGPDSNLAVVKAVQ